MVLKNPWEPEQGNNESQIKLRERTLTLFNTCQCSWCKLFYTQPFLCVPGTLHSNCSFFKALSDQEKQVTQSEKRNWSWSWRAIDMVLRVQDHGVLKRCWFCRSLNPNPDKYVCWKCGKDSLSGYNIYKTSSDFDVATSEKQVQPIKNVPEKITDIQKSEIPPPPKFDDSANKVVPASESEKPDENKVFKICPNPKCGKRTLVLNETNNSYSCINPDCPDYEVPIFKVTIDKHNQQAGVDKKTQNGLSPKDVKPSIVEKRLANVKTQPNINETNKKKPAIVSKSAMPKWLTALLLIFALSFIGLVINALIGSLIPFWILFGFSVVFSIEKWFSYETRKHKTLGKLYRLILNLAILSLLAVVMWSGVRLFSHQLVHSAMVGSILFVGEFAFFIWAWTIVAKNSWRWPSMKLTVFTLICLFLVFAFAGVQPFATYKDSAWHKIESAFSTTNNNQSKTNDYNNTPGTNTISSIINQTPITQIGTTVTLPAIHYPITTQTAPLAKGINPATGVYGNYYLGLADTPEGVLSGDGCYDDTGDFVVLINNRNAVNPTYAQLVNFLQNDTADEYPYIYTDLSPGYYYGTAESHVDLQNIQNIIDGTTQPKNPDICADFAERLHNDAEMDGIRCAYVSIELSGYPDPNNLGIPSNVGHALDAFQTTDDGLVYVDDTGWVASESHPTRAVTTVNVEVGQPYIAVSLFPEAGWQNTDESMGTVTSLQVIWDGTWN